MMTTSRDAQRVVLTSASGTLPGSPGYALDTGRIPVTKGKRRDSVLSASRTPVKGHGRRPLPADLPRERRVHDVPPDQRACPECGHDRVPIGEETSEQLDYR